MSETPEHDKLAALREQSPIAADLAALLLDSPDWELRNDAITPPVAIPVQAMVADLIGVNLPAYVAERTANYGDLSASFSIAATILSWQSAGLDGEPTDDAVTATETVVETEVPTESVTPLELPPLETPEQEQADTDAFAVPALDVPAFDTGALQVPAFDDVITGAGEGDSVADSPADSDEKPTESEAEYSVDLDKGLTIEQVADMYQDYEVVNYDPETGVAELNAKAAA